MARPRITYEDTITKEVKDLIPKWKKSGMNDKQIAKKIGISSFKLMEFKKQNSEFSNLFKRGKEDLLVELENTLYRRAFGYDVDDMEVTVEKDRDGNIIKTVSKKRKRHIWSDSCLQMALKKLDFDKWGDKKEDPMTNVPKEIVFKINGVAPGKHGGGSSGS